MVLKRSKGITLTISGIFTALLVIGMIALLLYLFFSRVLRVHVIISENLIERRAINLAEVLITADELTYKEKGIPLRGVLNATALDELMSSFEDKKEGEEIKELDLDIWYPNSFFMVSVYDLEERCDENSCKAWFGHVAGETDVLKGVSEIVNCLWSNLRIEDIPSYLFGSYVWDFAKCVTEEYTKYQTFVSSSEIARKGLPVLIRYGDKTHVGKIIVWGVSV